MSQLISLSKAIAMTTLYRNEKENILAPAYQNKNILCKCESFDRTDFDAILANKECVGLRIYYGMDEEKKVHAIIVGYNAKDEDILPVVSTALLDPPLGEIIDNGKRCPVDCPPTSPLNP